MFNGVEVRRVSGQVFELVPGFGDDILDILSLVESGVVHHDDASRRKFGQQVLHGPCPENISMNVCLEQPDGMQESSGQRTDDIGSPFNMPAPDTMASLPHGSISMRARHIMSKSTFIKVNNRAADSFILPDFLLEEKP